MDKTGLINYWLETSKPDYDACFDLFKNTQRYDWALFIAHLSREKLLKAAWIKNNNNNHPPLIHNLLKLSNDAGLDITEDQKTTLTEFNDFNIETRYPDIDVAIVSDDFEGMPYYDRKRMIKFILKISDSLELHPFKTDEFLPELNPFVEEILKTGIMII